MNAQTDDNNRTAVAGPVERQVRPVSVAHGSDEHLTLLGAPWHWNLLHGVDRADMLAFGRACMLAERQRCAGLCDSAARQYARQARGGDNSGASDHMETAAQECASDIRDGLDA